MVLHALDRRDPAGLGHLRGRHDAHPEVADQPLPLQLGERRERLLDGSVGGAVERADAEVHDVEHVERQVREVVVDGLAELGRGERLRPAALRVAQGSDLGHDVQALRVLVQRLLDERVRVAGAVEVGRVDVRDAERDGLAQHGAGRIRIRGRPEHARPRELHGAVAEARDGEVVGEREEPSGQVGRHGGPLGWRGGWRAPTLPRPAAPVAALAGARERIRARAP